MTRSPFILAGVAALMGAAGVALAAAGVHANGGELAQRGALFLLLHAVAALAIAAHARMATASAGALLVVGFVMEAGAILFSAELAMHVFTGERIFPFAAADRRHDHDPVLGGAGGGFCDGEPARGLRLRALPRAGRRSWQRSDGTSSAQAEPVANS